jgi:hypothetical protein
LFCLITRTIIVFYFIYYKYFAPLVLNPCLMFVLPDHEDKHHPSFYFLQIFRTSGAEDREKVAKMR